VLKPKTIQFLCVHLQEPLMGLNLRIQGLQPRSDSVLATRHSKWFLIFVSILREVDRLRDCSSCWWIAADTISRQLLWDWPCLVKVASFLPNRETRQMATEGPTIIATKMAINHARQTLCMI